MRFFGYGTWCNSGLTSERASDRRKQSGHSGVGRLRLRLVSERNRFPSSRRRREPLVGRLGRRTTEGATASRRTVARRCLAAVLFRRWERCSEALIVSTVPEILAESRSRARSRWTSLSAVVVPRSRLSCTRESAVLTLWPARAGGSGELLDQLGLRDPEAAGRAGSRRHMQVVHRIIVPQPRSGCRDQYLSAVKAKARLRTLLRVEPEVARLRSVVELCGAWPVGGFSSALPAR